MLHVVLDTWLQFQLQLEECHCAGKKIVCKPVHGKGQSWGKPGCVETEDEVYALIASGANQTRPGCLLPGRSRLSQYDHDVDWALFEVVTNVLSKGDS